MSQEQFSGYALEIVENFLAVGKIGRGQLRLGFRVVEGSLYEDFHEVYKKTEAYDCTRYDTSRVAYFRRYLREEEVPKLKSWLEVGPGPYGTLTKLALVFTMLGIFAAAYFF